MRDRLHSGKATDQQARSPMQLFNARTVADVLIEIFSAATARMPIARPARAVRQALLRRCPHQKQSNAGAESAEIAAIGEAEAMSATLGGVLQP
jgi:hypothetical protein